MLTRRRTPSLFVAPLLVAASVAATGCNPHPIKPVEATPVLEDGKGLPLDVNKKVDVLLVIDNSGSMGEEQANLAANFGPFIEKLEDAGADYRIGITTTDLGGTNCQTGTGGELHLGSCLDRPETFEFAGDDQYDVACAAQCEYGDAELTIRPTPLTADGEASARPWIESFNGVDNLPEAIGVLDAFQCFAPQGISGCGWESPLEAMARALTNMQDPTQPEYGFLRHDALLAVLIVTDEVDCSFGVGMEGALFEAETFWAETANFATSAVCWNAGVACSGDSPYEDCWDVNLDAQGQETSDPAQMVLRPVSRYVEQLEAVAATKQAGREVLVSVIAGVPAGYSEGEAEQVFADSDDPEFQRDFGIGAGCANEVEGVVQTAIPPVRLETFASAFMAPSLGDKGRNLYSVCEADYTPAILDIVAGIELELPPACFPACVLDVDSSTEALDYSCDVLEEVGGEERELVECALVGETHELPAGEDACWIAKTGADLAAECVASKRNLEFELLRRPGVSVPGDVQVLAVCELSSSPSLDCGA
ncbi:hypothetical protein ENSA5_39910 [Enhygromyxa salina]|uniref:VWFA domain-containing protein n=1 Tax=Enhygromyxa salina TaxID=215803 RepID=A0A2S9XRN1_9BACT|nr:vWA domain-containing protein [Enhygromyxa salina]PRP95400.1 hypothetical protein ENSA5_39910 [Enhygromyxa salina]